MLNDNFHKVFNKLPVLGMLHLAGDDPVNRALEELAIYEEEGVDGAIVENYHGETKDVIDALEAIASRSTKVIVGVNILPNEYDKAFACASSFHGKFIQLDYVAGTYSYDVNHEKSLDVDNYKNFKEAYSEIVVLGGVWPKYYQPFIGSSLECDLKEAMQRVEAIVVTGEATGKSTPISKIKDYRKIIGSHPLIIGAGLNHDNAYEQLVYADGCIVGSCFKPKGDTSQMVERERVRAFMDVVKEARKYSGAEIL